MSEQNSIQEQNRQLAERINQEALDDPDSPYAGKFVGIANGQIAVVADTLRDMMLELRRVEPDPTRCRGVKAGEDPSKVEYIWTAA